MIYNGSDKHKQALFEKKQDKLTAGDNITLTPQSDGTVKISAEGGSGTVTDVLVDGHSVVNQDGEAVITMPSDFVGATSQQAGTHGLVPAPLVTDKDKFLKGDGTWGEAGGGNVDDVQMNGVSIVDANKIAKFNNYVELTQAQYDALPASKLTDGVLYCIKDNGIVEGDKYAPIIYSLEEREVGVWTDGKPLYQKTYYFANASNTTYTLEQTFNAIIQTQVGSWTDSGGYRRPIPYLETNLGVFAYAYNSKLLLQFSPSNATEVFVTVQYTKTTDVPGSGTWGTDGVPMVHYDGNENIIGTWLDKMTGASVPLYEKLIRFGSNGSSGKNSSDISTNILSNLNIRECIDCYFVIWQDSTYRKHQLYFNTNTQQLSNYPSASWTTHLVVRYTKTT